ncbi:MAG: GDP-mannose 4,6-dehydratase [Thaumarchaeota archaeon]|nr:GDP-mannose 4,6-dehydratase [Nitrososphaerota archaeon]
MKILVTGGAGFIGSHLSEKYVEEGHTVLCLDNLMNGNLVNIRHLLNKRNFKLIIGDVRDIDLLEKLMRGVDVVLHLAAQIHVDRSIIEPKLTYEINVLGTQNVLEVSRMYDVKRVVFTSSSEVYGSAKYVPMDEKHPLDAPHPYGASKIAADRMCHAYAKTYGMDVVIVRPFNIFGPKQKDSGYGGAISIFVKRVLRGTPPIIYGDGKQSRDYTYIKDAVRAFDSVVKYEGEIEGPINFGTGKDIEIEKLARLIIKLCGKEGEIEPVHVEPRPSEVRRLVADYSKAKRLFGWEPKYRLEEGLMEFIDWYRNYKSEEWSKPA